MPNKQIKIGIQLGRALIVADSYNKEQGTLDVVMATEMPVLTTTYGEPVYEVLTFGKDNIRMGRADLGLPLLETHPSPNISIKTTDVFGKVENIKVVNNQMIGTIRLGANASDSLRSDIENKIIDTFSIGYKPYSGMYQENSEGLDTLVVTDWEPNHLAIAPIPADYNARARSDNEENVFQIDNYKSKIQKMTIEQIRATATTEQLARLDAIVEVGRSAKLADEAIIGLYNSEFTVEAIRSLNPAKPKVEPVNIDAIRSAATAEHKARIDAILLSGRAAKLDDNFLIDLIQSEKTVEQCRHDIITKFAEGDPKPNGNHGAGLTVGLEAIDKKREAAEGAILNRIDSKVFPLADSAREYRGMSVHEIALSLYGERSGKIQIIGKDKMSDMIFGKREMTTSDFPLLLENVLQKGLRAEYQLEPEYWNLIARETSVADFKPKALYQVGSDNGMKEMAEGEEIKYGKMVEAKQTISIKEYAEGLKFTRRMFINDDLSAFQNIPNKFVRDWNLLRGDVVWKLLIDNVTMGDNKALFHADHGNLASSGAAITDTSLAAAMVAYKAQKDIAGNKIRVNPKYLIVSSDKEWEAKRVLYTGLNPAEAAKVNLFAGTLTIIVEPRLSGNTWYLASDPSGIDGLYYCYMNGNAGLRSNRDDDFGTDSIKFGVRGEFGAQAIDYRGWYKNPGA